jgi:hypothetical protein
VFVAAVIMLLWGKEALQPLFSLFYVFLNTFFKAFIYLRFLLLFLYLYYLKFSFLIW